MANDDQELERQKDQTIKDLYNEVKDILSLLKNVKKLKNDVVGGQIARLLTDELRTKNEYLLQVTNL